MWPAPLHGTARTCDVHWLPWSQSCHLPAEDLPGPQAPIYNPAFSYVVTGQPARV